MKVLEKILLTLVFIVLLPGCDRAVNLEDLSITLVIGMDLDDESNITTYVVAPVFSSNVKGSTQVLESKAPTLRQARQNFDSMTAGMIVGGKIQVVLVGKRLLKKKNWFTLLDVFFRDSKLSLSARVVAVDGNVSDVVNLKSQDLPLLPLRLTSLIDTNEKRGQTVKTNLQQLDIQMHDKGVTPYISSIRLDGNKITATGTVLLDKKGKMATTLNPNETTLFYILMNSDRINNGQASLFARFQDVKKSGLFDTGLINMSINQSRLRIKPGYRNEKFYFPADITLSMALKERLFPYDMKDNLRDFEQEIESSIRDQLEQLLEKFQKHHVDPIGLGRYARAYQYEQWKKVQNNWGEAFSRADIPLNIDTTIKYIGPVK
ncbi:Ger(x)C family spore germination protein [Cohnella sp.]|uniref:Ger(x)C family spore germination protein n=1 Tax=Cohnella sp. TaxID=1883426 RepID=UPI00356677E2